MTSWNPPLSQADAGYIISLENQLAQAELTRRELHNIIQAPCRRGEICLGSQDVAEKTAEDGWDQHMLMQFEDFFLEMLNPLTLKEHHELAVWFFSPWVMAYLLQMANEQPVGKIFYGHRSPVDSWSSQDWESQDLFWSSKKASFIITTVFHG